MVIATLLALTVYVLLYPVFGILVYFRYISSDHGIGHVPYMVFMPLGLLERHSDMARVFFQ